jgi:hypothetical protein
MPTKDQVRNVAVDFLVSAALEIAMIKLAGRLKNGPAHPDRRPLRRLAAAMLSELAAQGTAELYWQRRRMHSALEHAAASESVAPRNKVPASPPGRARVQLPEQRQPEPTLVREAR